MITMDFFYTKEISEEEAIKFFKDNSISEIRGTTYIGVMADELVAVLTSNTNGKGVLNTDYIEKPGYKVLNGFEVAYGVLEEMLFELSSKKAFNMTHEGNKNEE